MNGYNSIIICYRSSIYDRSIADPTFAKKGELPQEIYMYIPHESSPYSSSFSTFFSSMHISFKYFEFFPQEFYKNPE